MEHLEDIHSYYFLDPEDKEAVKPISRIDCEIIETIVSILERLGLEQFHHIISRWKLESDNDTLEALEHYLSSENLENQMNERGGDFFKKLFDKLKKAYVKIGDTHIHANKIFIISKHNYHDGQRPRYSLIINDEKHLPQNTTSWYQNLQVDFASLDQREIEFESLKRLLTKNTMCKFLN
jgi:hypothetical protein